MRADMCVDMCIGMRRGPWPIPTIGRSHVPLNTMRIHILRHVFIHMSMNMSIHMSIHTPVHSMLVTTGLNPPRTVDHLPTF